MRVKYVDDMDALVQMLNARTKERQIQKKMKPKTKTPALIGRPPVPELSRKQSYTVSLTPSVRDYFVSKYGSLTSAMQALIELENQYEVTRLKLAQLAAENRELRYLREEI